VPGVSVAGVASVGVVSAGVVSAGVVAGGDGGGLSVANAGAPATDRQASTATTGM
jgi:hypothetical protein